MGKNEVAIASKRERGDMSGWNPIDLEKHGRLFYMIGDDARKWRFTAKAIPVEEVGKYEHKKAE